MRAIAALWVIEPSFFNGRPSLTEIARQLGFTAANISPITAEFSRRFRITNVNQSHALNGEHGDDEPDQDDNCTEPTEMEVDDAEG